MPKMNLTGAVNFRTTEKMVADITAYQAGRQLRDFSDAARELMESAIETRASADLTVAAAEARKLNIDPVAAIRERIAQAASQHELAVVGRKVALIAPQ